MTAKLTPYLDGSVYYIERFINEIIIEPKKYNEMFLLALINSTVYVFFKRPKEALPILSKLF